MRVEETLICLCDRIYLYLLPSAFPAAYIIRTIRCTRSRYHTYLYLAPLKVAVFALMGFLLHGLNFFDYFMLFLKAWRTHPITLTVLGGTQVKLIRQWNLLMYPSFLPGISVLGYAKFDTHCRQW